LVGKRQRGEAANHAFLAVFGLFGIFAIAFSVFDFFMMAIRYGWP